MQKMYKTKVLSLGTWPTEGPSAYPLPTLPSAAALNPALVPPHAGCCSCCLDRFSRTENSRTPPGGKADCRPPTYPRPTASPPQAYPQPTLSLPSAYLLTAHCQPSPGLLSAYSQPTPSLSSAYLLTAHCQPSPGLPSAYPQPTLSLPYPQPQPLTQLSFPHMQAAAAAASTGSAAQRTAGPSGLSSRKRESSERPHQVVEQTVPSSLSSAYPHPIISLPSSHAQPTLSLPSPYPHPGLRRVKTSRTGPPSRRPAAGQGGARCRRRTRGSTCRWGRGRRQVPGSSWPSAPGAPS